MEDCLSVSIPLEVWAGLYPHQRGVFQMISNPSVMSCLVSTCFLSMALVVLTVALTNPFDCGHCRLEIMYVMNTPRCHEFVKKVRFVLGTVVRYQLFRYTMSTKNVFHDCGNICGSNSMKLVNFWPQGVVVHNYYAAMWFRPFFWNRSVGQYLFSAMVVQVQDVV